MAVKYGGFEEDFVDEVADRLTCHICTKPLRDPHLTKCCGQIFCESCLEQWSTKHKEEQCCPFCRSTGDDFVHFLDKRTKREINVLKVKCSNHRQGCEWIGELGTLQGHCRSAKTGCGYVEIKCPNGCYDILEEFGDDEESHVSQEIKQVLRKDLKHHLTAECRLRRYQCQYCGKRDTFEAITEWHYYECSEFPVPCPNRCCVMQMKRKEINKHRKLCPLEIIVCPFVTEGCKAWDLLQKDEAIHMQKNIVNHQLMMLKSLKDERITRQKERDKYDMELDRWDRKAKVIAKNIDSLLVTFVEEQRVPLQSIRSLLDESCCLTGGTSLSLTVSKFSEYKKSNGVWYSPPFYLFHITGLKARLALYPNGIESGAGTHVSIVLQNLETDLEMPVKIECGSFAQIGIGSRSIDSDKSEHMYYCITKIFCKCGDNVGSTGELHREYKFVPHRISEKLRDSNDTLIITVKLTEGIFTCLCACHL
jgi:hypothetical protein